MALSGWEGRAGEERKLEATCPTLACTAPLRDFSVLPEVTESSQGASPGYRPGAWGSACLGFRGALFLGHSHPKTHLEMLWGLGLSSAQGRSIPQHDPLLACHLFSPTPHLRGAKPFMAPILLQQREQGRVLPGHSRAYAKPSRTPHLWSGFR